jgi:group I intron endonuclease
MVGIYKITNLINQHCYVGQSRQIERRWYNHKIAAFNENDKAYEYPLYRAIRKYGLENFSFEMLEECQIDELNEKEIFWINTLNPEYNQTDGGDCLVTKAKLTFEQVKEIQRLMIEDVNGNLSHIELAKKYNVSKDAIRDINVGRTWFRDDLTYPLHYSKFDASKPNKVKFYCIDCNKEISKGATRCLECEKKHRKIVGAINRAEKISREELKQLIRTTPFTTIATQYGVTDNAVRKWCDKYNLPRRVKDIKSYSDEEWDKI